MIHFAQFNNEKEEDCNNNNNFQEQKQQAPNPSNQINNNNNNQQSFPNNLPQQISYDLLFSQLSPLISGIYQKQNTKQQQHPPSNQQLNNAEVLQYSLLSLQPQFFLKSNASLFQLQQENQVNQLNRQTVDVYAILKSLFKRKFIVIGFFKLITIILLFLSPYFLDQLTDSLKQLQFTNNAQDQRQLHLIKLNIAYNSVLLILSFAIFALCDTQYSWQINKLENEVRIYLNSLLYTQALNKKCISRHIIDSVKVKQKNNQNIVSSNSNNKDLELGEDAGYPKQVPKEENDANQGSKPQPQPQPQPQEQQEQQQIPELNNLLSIDTSQVLNSFISFHETWSIVLKLVVGLVYLYVKMKEAIIIGFIVTALLIWINFKIAISIGSNFESIMKHKDNRIELTRDVIRGAKQIKCLNWEHLFFRKILHIRNDEFDRIAYIKYLDAFCVFFWACSQLAISSVSLIFYYNYYGSFAQINIFTVIYLFGMLIAPLNSLPWTVGGLMTSRVSFDRINRFISKIPDYQLQPHQFQPPLQQQFLQQQQQQSSPSSVFINLKPSSFTWPKAEPDIDIQQQQHKSTEQAKETKQSFQLQIMHEIKILQGQLVFIVGPTGSGKTAFVNLILNELQQSNIQLQQQSVEYRGKISYAPQQFWLQNESIKDNILITNPFIKLRYQQVISACDLEQDIHGQNNPPQQQENEISSKDPDLHNMGDNRAVGPQGCNLSGGQKQRLNIGRAFYEEADIYLLDDIFSSVDPHVADVIFEKGVKQLLHNKIRIIIANDFKYIDSKVDQVIFIRSNGQVSSDPDDIEKYLGFNYKERQPQQLLNVSQKQEIKKDTAKQSDNTQIISEQYNPNICDIDQEKREEGEIKASTFQVYVKAMGYLALFTLLLSMCLMQLSFNFYDIWLKNFVNSSSQNANQPKPFLFNNSFIVTIIVLALIALTCTIFRAFSFAIANLKAARNIFKWLAEAVMFAKLHFYEQNELGRILMRFSGDTWAVDSNIAFESNILLKNLFIIAGSLTVIIAQTPLTAVPIAIMLYLYWRIQAQYRAASRELKRLDQVNASRFLSHINDSMDGVKVIRALNKQEAFTHQFFARMNYCIATNSLLSALSSWLSIRLQMLSILVSASLLLIVCGGACYITKEMQQNSFLFNFDANSLALCLVYSLQITNLLRDLTINLTSTEREFICLERINQYLSNNKLEIEIKDQNTNEFLDQQSQITQILHKNKNNSSSSANKKTDYALEYKNVSIQYTQLQEQQQDQFSTQTQNKIIQALKNISFCVKEGQKVAFCGRTGSGKTSIINALLRLYDIQVNEDQNTNQEQILLYGTETRLINLGNLRKQIAVIPQQGFIYKDTVRNNLDPDGLQQNHILQDKLNSIFSKQEEFISQQIKTKSNCAQNQQNNYQKQIPDLDMMLDSEGKNISQGEAQLLNFIRVALNEQASIICLDEATANLDQNYDNIVNKYIHQLSGKTVICISHRLDALKNFDHIFVMEDGKIAEQGNYDELIKEKGSLFNKLRTNQQQQL